MHQIRPEPAFGGGLPRFAFACTLAFALPQAAFGAAVIFNGGTPANSTVALGVNDQGHLNFFDDFFETSNAGATGLAFKFPDGTWRDATAPGCLCEGWGVAVTAEGGSRVAGGASVDSGGIFGLADGGIFGSTPSSATSQVSLSDAPLRITHNYGVSLSPNVFQGNVTLTNTSEDMVLTDVVYRRAMDWDVPPTEFDEFVTHQGVVANLEANGGNVRFASDNGFASLDPREDAFYLLSETVNSDFVDSGPADHGSVFDFAFGDLAAGESRNFNIFYGAFANTADAMAAIALLQPSVYSLGHSNPNPTYFDEEYPEIVDSEIGDIFLSSSTSEPSGSGDGSPATFLFGFGGVGGIAPGETSQNPVLPFVPAPGQFVFDNPAPGLWYDPPFAEGFAYELLGDPTAFFTEVGVPDASFGFGDLTLLVGGSSFVMSPGAIFDFSANGFTNVTSFEIVGFDPFLDVAAPGFATAFPTYLDFTGSPTTLTMQYIEVASNAVPTPATLLLLTSGLGMLIFVRRRRSA